MIKDSLEVVTGDRLATNVVTYNGGVSSYVPQANSTLITPQTITGTWSDCGSLVTMSGCNAINFLIDLDINDSLGVQFRAICNITENPSLDYKFSIYNVKNNTVYISEEFSEIENNQDQQFILQYQTQGLPYIQLQVRATTTGLYPASIKSLYEVKLWV